MSPELFRDANDYVRTVLDDVHDWHLALPTPCSEWRVAHVVCHLADVADALSGLLATGEMVMPGAPQTCDAEPAVAARAAIDGLIDALAEQTDSERADSAYPAGIIEFTAHGWDIGVALDADHRIPEALAIEVLALASALLPEADRGANFAAPRQLSAGAAASGRLVAFLGRRPVR